MKYLSVAETAKRWKLSERTVRNYCANGRVDGAFITGKTWNIPETAEKPGRIIITKMPKNVLEQLKEEKRSGIKGGIYHKVQVDLTYNSNHIEGSRLTHDQTRYIYETNTIGIEDIAVNVDDIVETANHFRCIDYIIDYANKQLSEKMIKELHSLLKSGTSDSRKSWFNVGDYKAFANEVGGNETTAPDKVSEEMKSLLKSYNSKSEKTLKELLAFHVEFEKIHPFQDGNGRVGRLILFKECLKNEIVPFIIDEDIKLYYYRGLKEWNNETGFLMDTCLAAQDKFKKYLDYFGIPYEK